MLYNNSIILYCGNISSNYPSNTETMNIFGLLLITVILLWGFYEYLLLCKRKFKELIKDYEKLKEIEKELRDMFKIKESKDEQMDYT